MIKYFSFLSYNIFLSVLSFTYLLYEVCKAVNPKSNFIEKLLIPSLLIKRDILSTGEGFWYDNVDQGSF